MQGGKYPGILYEGERFKQPPGTYDTIGLEPDYQSGLVGSKSTVLKDVRDGSVAAKMAPVQVGSSNPNIEKYIRASPFLAFFDISNNDVLELLQIPTENKSELKAALAEGMSVGKTYDVGSFSYEICSDFHFYNWQFCKSQGFDALKTGTFMSELEFSFHFRLY